MVDTGSRAACSTVISVPSFCARYGLADSPRSASALVSAWVTCPATVYRAALSTVAFSRSSRPSEPISWLIETGSPYSRLTSSSTARSCSSPAGLNTPVTATASARTPSRKRRIASGSSGPISRPST